MTNEEFRQKFKLGEHDRVILWTGTEMVGFTIQRCYPVNSWFIPAKTKDGEDDDVVGIWIGYHPKEVKDKSVRLFVRISKVSLYLQDNHWDYNFADPKSPTEESIKISKKSRQPIELEETTSYQFNLVTGKFFDKEKDKEIEPDDIINSIFYLHVETVGYTIRGAVFRAKFKFKERIINFSGKIIKGFLWCNYKLFDKQIKDNTEHVLGFHRTYPHADLITVKTDKITIPGTDLSLTKKVSIATAFLIFIGFFLDYFVRQIKFVDFLGVNGDNIIFVISFAVVVYVTLDMIIPHLILISTNLFVKFRWWLFMLRINIKS